MPDIARSTEAEAFLDTRDRTAPEVLSACAGWTAHEVTAHLAAAAAEVTAHLRPYLDGEPVPPTRGFEEREAPYRALPDAELRRRLDGEERTVRSVLGEVLDREPDAVIPWTGRRMAVAKFLPHLRNEFALHRWDIAGDDDVSTELLGNPDLIAHAVEVLGGPLLARGAERDPRPEQDLRVRLRTDAGPDVRLTVESGTPRLELAGRGTDEPYLALDAAARTLVVWGRRPSTPGRIRSHADQGTLHRMQALLSGY